MPFSNGCYKVGVAIMDDWLIYLQNTYVVKIIKINITKTII